MEAMTIKIKGGQAMKRWIAGILAVAVLGTMLVVAPRPAAAGGWHRGGSGSSNFWGGFAVGAITGVVAGAFVPRPVYTAPAVVYQPAPVYVVPAPVYVAPAPVVYQAPPAYPVYAAPAPVCANYWVNGYWYGPNWVAGHWEQACR